MSGKAVKVTGTQVKELLAKAVGGIYLSRYFDVMTDFYNRFAITDDGLEITVNDMLTAKIPIQDNVDYINFAVGYDISESEECEDVPYEEWESSSYFDYKFEIANYMLCFNVADEDRKLTWERFKELVANEKYVHYKVQNIDGGSICMDMDHCEIQFTDADDSCFNICSLYANMEIDKSVVDAIYNDSTESEDICYRIEFNNGISDMTIEVDRDSKVF